MLAEHQLDGFLAQVTRVAEPEVGRRAGKDVGRRHLNQVDEPDEQRAPRGRYLRVRHQTDEQAHERESVRVNRTAHQRRTRACQILPPPRSLTPLGLCNGRPLGRLKTTTFPPRSPQPSDPEPRRGLALAGVPAPNDAPFSTSTSALHRSRPLYRHDAKGQGRAATARRCGGLASGTDQLCTCSGPIFLMLG